jgi:hypothetical protein
MPDFDRAALEKRWIHSHEEDAPGRMVFRPDGWRFPPSRGRRSFALAPGGALTAARPGPDDRSQATGGQWRLRDDGVLELDGQEYRVLEVHADKLVVER